MKRIIGLVLITLLLCACTAQPQNEATTFPTETTGVMTLPTEPAGIYEADSDLEIRTGGALRSYHPSVADCYGMRTIGSDILLFSGTDVTTLTRLSGENLFTVADTQLDCRVRPEDTSFQISANGITYYDGESREVVFLDNDLKEVSRIPMPEEMVGKPILSSNRMKVYYCTADAVRIYDLETGLDMLLKSVSYPEQCMEDILLKDTVLRCSLLDAQGMAYTMFLSAQTGELLGQIRQGIAVSTGGDAYYAVLPEGSVSLLLFGLDGEETVLTPRDLDAESWFLEDQRGAVTVSTAEGRSVLDYYDLTSGLRTASVELPAAVDTWYVEPDADGSRVYLMGCDCGYAFVR